MKLPPKLPAYLEDLLATRDSGSHTPPAPPVAMRRPRVNRRAAPGVATREQRSLFGEILDWMFAPLLLLWPLSVAITFLVARTLAEAPFDRALVDRVRVIAEQVRWSGNTVQATLPSAARELLRADDQASIYYQVIDPQGEAILGTSDLPAPALYDFPEAGVVKLRNDEQHGTEIRVGYLYVEPRDAGMQARPALVQVAETLEKRTRLANEIIKGVIFPQFLILPLAVGLVWFGLGRGLAPLKSMQQRIRDRDPDDLSPIDPRGVPEEISPLVDAFNDLLQRLDSSIAAQKRFIADAAHQLKTPLAGLRTQAELALRETDAQEVRRSLEQLVRSAERGGHVVSQLLALARMENQRDRVPFDALDLNPLARRLVTDRADEAIRRGIDFGFETDDRPAPIVGHPLLLAELFNNLIDNALRYASTGGTVTVSVRTAEPDVVLEVEDNGPGVAAPERELIFERFYRGLDTQSTGSGLGLAIVREIAEQHAATVSVEDAHPERAPPGARFVVRFPKVIDEHGTTITDVPATPGPHGRPL